MRYGFKLSEQFSTAHIRYNRTQPAGSKPTDEINVRWCNNKEISNEYARGVACEYHSSASYYWHGLLII